MATYQQGFVHVTKLCSGETEWRRIVPLKPEGLQDSVDLARQLPRHYERARVFVGRMQDLRLLQSAGWRLVGLRGDPLAVDVANGPERETKFRK